MAGHLLTAGFPLKVYNRTGSKADALIERGAKRADTPADAAREVEYIFICVGDTPDVETVLFGDDGVAETISAGSVVVDHSTISPTATKQFAARFADRGVGYIDAPVSGGDLGAKNGTLSIMCGGEADAFSRLRPAFDCYGKTITHCGPAGHGQLTKLVNQILVAVTNLAVSEAVTFIEQAGLDPQTTLQAVGGGAAGSWQLQNLAPRMLAGDYAPGFTIDFQQKDLRLVLDYAREQHLPLLATSLVHQLFTTLQAQGHGRDGTQALVRSLRVSRLT